MKPAQQGLRSALRSWRRKLAHWWAAGSRETKIFLGGFFLVGFFLGEVWGKRGCGSSWSDVAFRDAETALVGQGPDGVSRQ